MLCRDTSRGRHSSRVVWFVCVRTYCVPVAIMNQNKRSRLLYLGDAKIISRFSGKFYNKHFEHVQTFSKCS